MVQKCQNQKTKPTLCWTIFLPFSLSPGKNISLGGEVYSGQIGRRNCDIHFEGQYYILKVYGFSRKAQAEAFVKSLGVGLMWAGAATRTGVRFDLDLQNVEYSRNPYKVARNIYGHTTHGPVDALIHGDQTAVYRSDKKVLTITGRPASVTQGLPVDRFVSTLTEGSDLPNPTKVVDNEKIKTASELYSLSHFMTSLRARFLTQITALEILSEQPYHPAHLQVLIDLWIAEIGALYDNESDSDERRRLNRLRTGICRLKRDSITESVRVLVRKALTSLKDPNACKLIGRVGPIYGVRSALTHGRRNELGQAPAELEEIVSKTLRAVIKQPSLLTI
ncbi:MAG: hypothetical protein MN733_13270 [Nitrososphaera sp.]|nr:hypothetical protein [Nitrososphaera sp.]